MGESTTHDIHMPVAHPQLPLQSLLRSYSHITQGVYAKFVSGVSASFSIQRRLLHN